MEGVSRRVLVTTAVLVSLATCGSGYRCEVETIWGSTRYLNCPESGDDPDAVFCCGSDDNKYCCASLIGEEALEDLIDNLPTIIGVIFAIILTMIVLCIVCCCCCPFCLIYKRRNQGTIHNPNPEVAVMQPLQTQPPQAYPPQGYPPQQQPPYPMQPQPMHPSQAGYPPQPYPPTGYPSDQPPMYTEKQPPPYNPTY